MGHATVCCVVSLLDMRDHLSEGRIRLETILRLAGDGHTKERARVAQFLGALTTAQGDFAAAELFLDQSLALYQQVGDEWGVAASFNAKGIGARDRGDYSSAQIYLERSLERWRVLSDGPAIARCLHNLANVVKVVGDYPRAKWALREATDIFEELGDHSGAAWSVSQQGDIAREEATFRPLVDFISGHFRSFGRQGIGEVPRERSPTWVRSIVSREIIRRRKRPTARLWKLLSASGIVAAWRGRSKAGLVWRWHRNDLLVL